ncbi:MAG: hypothetical protein ACOH15_11360 [Acetobacterium sp.]
MNNRLSMQDIVKTYYSDDEDLGVLKHSDYLVDAMTFVLFSLYPNQRNSR